MFFREAEGQHSSEKFRVGRNSLDIFSPVRDGERILLQSFAGCNHCLEYTNLSNRISLLFLSIIYFNIYYILDYKGHRLSDASSGKKGEISLLASVMTEGHDKITLNYLY